VFCHHPDEFWPSYVTSCSKALPLLDPLLRLTFRLSDHPCRDKYPAYRECLYQSASDPYLLHGDLLGLNSSVSLLPTQALYADTTLKQWIQI